MQATPIILQSPGFKQSPRPQSARKQSWARWLFVGVFLLIFGGVCSLRLVSPVPLFAAAGLGLLALAALRLYRWRVQRKWKILIVGLVPVAALTSLGVRTHLRYRTQEVMDLTVREYSHVEYPEDPGECSIHCGNYHGRTLRLVRKDATHFDFILEPTQPHVAKVVFHDVDVSLLTPSLPEWTYADEGLPRIALTDRQWNRQQVRFGGPGSPHVEVTGGDGWEKENLYSAELASNCLNAG